MPDEVWKDIEGYKGAYQVSNFGRARGLPRTITLLNRGLFLSTQKIKEQIKRHLLIFN